jgi:EpsI family protein
MDDRSDSAPPPGGISRRNIVLGSALLGVAAAAYARMPQPHVPKLEKDGLDKRIPKQIGPWTFATASGIVMPPPDELSDRLYSHTLTRYYYADNAAPIALLIAYSNVQDGLLQLHRPEICYPASGYKLTETQVSPLDLGRGSSIPVRTFTADGVSRNEKVLYWTRLGEDIPTSWAAQRWAVAKANLEGNIPDGILVRVSTESSDTLERSMQTLTSFSRMMLASVTPDVRKLLIGDR